MICDHSTFLGLVFFQNILEVVEELVLVDPAVVSKHRRKFIENKQKINKATVEVDGVNLHQNKQTYTQTKHAPKT